MNGSLELFTQTINSDKNYMFQISWKFALIKQLVKARVPVMKSAESGGTINHRLILEQFDETIRLFKLITMQPKPAPHTFACLNNL